MASETLFLAAALASALTLGAQAPEAPAAPEARYSLEAHQQDIQTVLQAFARRTRGAITIPELPTQLVTVVFKDLPFEEALKEILLSARLDYRKVDGVYVVGLPMDLKVRFPEPDETILDATYRCRRVGADSLANAVRQVLPDLKVTIGPMFLSPTLDSSGNASGESQVKVLGATDIAFRTHDVLFSGPADQVRRAMAIAQKFDRPRKQVRITIKVVAIDHNAAQNLGVQWMPSIAFTAAEQTGASTAGSLVDGIRLGKFSHSPLVVNATLNALEEKGKSKTLSNPTLLLLDGERSFILSGERYLYPKYTGKDQNGQSIYEVGTEKIGVYLQVGVQIGLDNDMVLSLYPQITSIASTRIINGAEYPTIATSEEHTTVRATSGEMVVLGGMMQDATSTQRTGLPFLSRLPFLGSLFSSSTDKTDKSELMLMLTPVLLDETLPEEDVKVSVTGPEG